MGWEGPTARNALAGVLVPPFWGIRKSPPPGACRRPAPRRRRGPHPASPWPGAGRRAGRNHLRAERAGRARRARGFQGRDRPRPPPHGGRPAHGGTHATFRCGCVISLAHPSGVSVEQGACQSRKVRGTRVLGVSLVESCGEHVTNACFRRVSKSAKACRGQVLPMSLGANPCHWSKTVAKAWRRANFRARSYTRRAGQTGPSEAIWMNNRKT